MKIAIIYFTKNGKNVANKVSGCLESFLGQDRDLHVFSKWRGDSSYREEPLMSLTKEQFSLCDGLIFVGAVGIAIRSIAPYLGHKYKDPAVLVVDELGKYCIPILSGHVGGANDLALKISSLYGGQMLPIITTATDLSGKWAVDVFAKKHCLLITDPKRAKEISAGVLDGKEISVYVEEGMDLKIFEDLKNVKDLSLTADSQGADIYIGIRKSKKNEKALRLVPRSLVLGLGCKKNTERVKIEQAVSKVFLEQELSIEAVDGLCSIDLKAEEEGLHAFCKTHGISAKFYSAGDLKKVAGDFTGSAFVKSITGVDNVCERAALLGAGKEGDLLVKKHAMDGVTVAVARINKKETGE